MRAPFQILAIPYRIVDGTPIYCVFHRADHDQWQFIAGGGEDNETPLAAAKRETFEEGGVHSTQWLGLKSLSYIPVTIISVMRRKHWDSSTYVIPEYTFGFECQDDVRLSPEHTDCVWLTYDEANQKLKWDSNRIYEDNVAGRLDDERFALMSKNYTEEQKNLKAEVKNLQQQIHEQEQQAENIEQFVQRVKRSSTLTELPPMPSESLSRRSM